MDGRRPPTEANQHVALVINTPWLESVKYRAGMSLPRKPPAKPTIFRVPPSVRCGNQSAYEPKLVSIGPYLRGKSEDLKAMEQLKWRLLHNYLSKVPNGSANEGLRKMNDLEKRARDCYSEVIDLDSDRFVEMLLLDGCFLILIIIAGDKLRSIPDNCLTKVIRSLPVDDEEEVIRSLPVDDEEKVLFHVKELGSLLFQDPANELKSLLLDNIWLPGLIFQDLLLLENQLPYFIIEHLLDTLGIPGCDSSCLQKAAVSCFKDHFLPQYYNVPKEPEQTSQEFQDVDHLLDLFHKWIVRNKEEASNTRSCNKLTPGLHCSALSLMIKKTGDCLSKVLPCCNDSSLSEEHQLSVPIMTEPADQEHRPSEPAMTEDAKKIPSSPPTMTELVEAGVKIKVKEAKSFLNISFCENKGVLEIPAIEVDDHTNFLLANLTALEQSHCTHGLDVTHYTLFLDGIINTPMDVELLHQEEIIHRDLGDNTVIASLFNKLGNGVTYDPKNNYLKNVHIGLNAYCQSRWPRWRAKAVRDYFSSPWAIISLGAAVVLLGLTILQSVYAVLDYYKK